MSRTTDLDAADLFDSADLRAPADLFITRRSGSSRSGLTHRRFDTAMEAITFALDNFASRGPNDVVMAVDDKRFNLAALRTISRSGRHQASASGSEQTP